MIIAKGIIVKLGLDVHARQITVCRQTGDRTPQPAQVFTKERLRVWIRKMGEAVAIVHSCYEAGVMGYTLHRELTALGAQNVVVAPQKLSGPKRQKPDALDARTLVDRLDRWLRALVAEWQATAFDLVRRERALRAQLEAAAPKELPRGIGALTWVTLARKICDWARFHNRRQVASYTGLCPGVHQSNDRGREGSINRCGNRAVRTALVELVWGLALWQPDCPPVRAPVDRASLSPRRERKLAIAAASPSTSGDSPPTRPPRRRSASTRASFLDRMLGSAGVILRQPTT